MLNKPIIFYDIEITFWWFYDTNMFIRCIISLQKIGRSLTEVNCVQISSFREKNQFWLDNFFAHWIPFLTICTSLKWNGGPGCITNIFNVHWGILGAIVSLKFIPSLIFKSIFVLKSWLSCFRGTATYVTLDFVKKKKKIKEIYNGKHSNVTFGIIIICLTNAI